MRRRKRRESGKRRILRKGLVVASATLAAVLLLSVTLTLPLRFLPPPTTAFMLQDASGRDPLAWQWRDAPYLPLAVVAAEDQKFLGHAGFDVESIEKALARHEAGGRLRGASTISQQLAKNLYLWPGRSFLRKGLEAWLTVFLELTLPKRRILELYVNVAEFGPGIYGAEAAARHHFGKSASGLTRYEAALLAGVLPSPKRLDAGRPSRYLRERQRWILGQMTRLERERFLAGLD